MGAAPSLRLALADAARAAAERDVRVGLTVRQKTLSDFVRAELEAGRPSPSYDEMRVFMGLRSKSGINRLVVGIVERGHLVRLPNRARTLALPGTPVAKPAPIASAPADPKPRVAVSRADIDRLAAYAALKGLSPRDVFATALTEHMRRNP